MKLFLKPKQVAAPRRWSLPNQIVSCPDDAGSTSLEYMEINPHGFGISEVFYPRSDNNGSHHIFADRGAFRRRGKQILLDRELVDHIDQIRSRHRAVSITDRILGLYRSGPKDLEPVVLAKPLSQASQRPPASAKL